MANWDALDCIRPLDQNELELKLAELEDYKKWSLYEEVMWRQNSRELWLKEGDRNIKFFQKLANSHRRKNSLSKLRIEGMWVTEEANLKQGVVNAFQSLLSKKGDWRASLDGLSFS